MTRLDGRRLVQDERRFVLVDRWRDGLEITAENERIEFFIFDGSHAHSADLDAENAEALATWLTARVAEIRRTQ